MPRQLRPNSIRPRLIGTITDAQVILNVIGNARFTPPKIIGIQIDNPSFPNPFGGAQTVPPPSLSVIGLTTIPAFENNPKVFNFPLRNLPTESITSANFGRVTSVSQARAVQFTLQVDF